MQRKTGKEKEWERERGVRKGEREEAEAEGWRNGDWKEGKEGREYRELMKQKEWSWEEVEIVRG